jgi:heme A synthase
MSRSIEQFTASDAITARSPGLHRFAVLTSAATFVLIFVGGLVTSTGSALAVPDWPLSFGKFFPKMEGGVLYEHGHRMIAATVTLLTLALMVWVSLRSLSIWRLLCLRKLEDFELE